MRWKFSRGGNSMYTCLWCFHVKTGTFLLGIISLLLQVATLALVTVAFLRPDFVPPWVSDIVAPSGNENDISMHGKMSTAGIVMMKVDATNGGMMSVHDIENKMMRDSEMMDERDIKKVMKDHGMFVDDVSKTLAESDVEQPEKGNHWPDDYSSMNDRMKHNYVMAGSDTERKAIDIGIYPEMSNIPKGMIARSPSSLPNFDGATDLGRVTKKTMELDSDDKLLLTIMLVGCILASVMLIHGVMKGRPGYLMPYMGLQVFDFCVSCLIVFTCFSYAPNIKRWIAAQPESLPIKAKLLAIDTDRLMLGVIMIAVLILVVKAYFMAVVWACYKYLTQVQHDAVRGLRRSAEEDIHNPEDTELLLPPKYEDIVNLPQLEGENEPAPPPYHAT